MMCAVILGSFGAAALAMFVCWSLASALTAAVFENEAGSFRNDTVRVVWGVLCTFGRYVGSLGFHTEEFYVMRSRVTLVVWSKGEERPFVPERLKPWKLYLPGWSRFTRIHSVREREVDYFWL